VADEQQASSGAKGKRAASSRPDADQLRRGAAESYDTYARALSRALAETDPSGPAQNAYGDYVQLAGSEWTPERLTERYAEASRSYLRAMQAYLDPEQDNLQAYRSYILELAEQWRPEQAQATARDAYNGYVERLGDALDPDELERRSQEAWAEYIERFKDACGQLDASADPETVAAQAQSALAAAAATQSMREVVKQRRAAQHSISAAGPT
jgi:hypothetical protein